MGRKPLHRTHCNVEGCDKPVHGDRDATCTQHRKQFRAAAERERREKYGRRDNEDGEIMQLIAFPEPEKFLKLVNDITERTHTDKRTIEHRSGKSVAGPLGRAQLAGGE